MATSSLGVPMPSGINVDIVGIKALRNRLKGLGKSKKITEPLRRRLVATWQAGAEAFLRAALKKVAVDTGMSAATFLELARALNRNRAVAFVEAAIASPPRGQQKGVPTFPSGARRPGIQDTKEGERLGQRAFIFSVPESVPELRERFVFKFSFQTVSWQMAFHDEGVIALTNGIEAFEARVSRQFEDDARFLLREFFAGKTLPNQGILT